MENMGNVRKDVFEAVNLITSGCKRRQVYQQFDECFLFGTENQEGINSAINYDGKDVLTTSSSGDQYLGAIYYGANSVDIYDINRLTKYITYLKIAAIMELEYDEFIRFSIPFIDGLKNSNFWDANVIKKLINRMPNDAAYFWDYLCKFIATGQYNGLIYDKDSSNVLEIVKTGMPFYASEEEYNVLKTKLLSKGFPKFYEVDISKYEEIVGAKYDLVYLSNIVEIYIVNMVVQNRKLYVLPMDENGVEKLIVPEILKNIYPNLREDGMYLVDYRPNKDICTADDYLFTSNEFEVNQINPKNFHKGEKDLVLTYRPSDKQKIWE